MTSPPTGAVILPTAVPARITPLALILSAVLAATPTVLAAQRTEHGDWYHVARIDSATQRNTSYAATVSREGAGGMTVLCGAIGLPVVAFIHAPLAGTAEEAGVRLSLEHAEVSAWREGDVDRDRRATRVTYRLLDLIRYRATDDDRVRVRIEASDTADAVDMVFSARGLRKAVQRLRCVSPIQSDSMNTPPQLVNGNEVEKALEHFYPPRLRDRGIGGTVNVWMFIDRNGRVTDAMVNEPSRFEAFDQAALKVARIMRFTPAQHGPQRIPVWVAFDVSFEVW